MQNKQDLIKILEKKHKDVRNKSTLLYKGCAPLLKGQFIKDYIAAVQIEHNKEVAFLRGELKKIS